MKLSITPKWGVRVFAAWAFVLAVLALANILVLTAAVEFYSNLHNNQAQVWFIFAVNVGFAVGFAVSTYGLWQKQNWGRITFLWLIAIWSGFNFASLFLPNLIFSTVRQSAAQLAGNGLRYLAGLVIPLWYFNLPRIKNIFITDETNRVKETNNG